MARSLSLAAYLAYARGAPQTAPTPTLPRPAGNIVWGHATDQQHLNVLVQVIDRILTHRPDVCILLTTKDNFEPQRTLPEHALWQRMPDDTVSGADAFLDHWQPDLCLWTCGHLMPAFLSCTNKKGTPLYLVDADEAQISRPSWRWFPDLPRSLIGQFTGFMARASSTERYLKRYGAAEREIQVTGPLIEETKSLNYNHNDLETLSEILRGRPIWLAVNLRQSELAAVLDAHRSVSRLAHRALLVIVPDENETIDAFHHALEESEWRSLTWSDGANPEETTQVILADTEGELGLWYRLAPISFMGNSLLPNSNGSDPNEPAAHGSAILYGPHIRLYLNCYSRLAEAGGAWIVRDADTLATAIQRLIPADQSAAMAHAAWDVATQSAEAMDGLVELVLDTLDKKDAK